MEATAFPLPGSQWQLDPVPPNAPPPQLQPSAICVLHPLSLSRLSLGLLGHMPLLGEEVVGPDPRDWGQAYSHGNAQGWPGA